MGKKKFFRKSTAILMTASLAAAALAGCGNSKDSGGGKPTLVGQGLPRK